MFYLPGSVPDGRRPDYPLGPIAAAHGATLTARARPEGGLGIEVSFPEPARIAGPPAQAAATRAGGDRVNDG